MGKQKNGKRKSRNKGFKRKVSNYLKDLKIRAFVYRVRFYKELIASLEEDSVSKQKVLDLLSSLEDD